MKKSPFSSVKERFETKEKLVEAVQKLTSDDLWLDRTNSEKGLDRVSNAKLLRLHDTLSDAKKRFGSRDKLITSILELQKRVKDQGYQKRLQAYPLPRLLDLHASATRTAKRAEPKAKPATPVKKAAVKKAAAKKAPVKKAPAKKGGAKKAPAKSKKK